MAQGLHYEDSPFLDEFEIVRIKTAIPELMPFHRDIMDSLWCDFSTTWHCAGGLGVEDSYIEDFRDYLLTDKRC